MYVTCSWGRGVVMSCALGTLFNRDTGRCDWASAVTCYSPPASTSKPQFIPPGQGIPPGHRRDPPGQGIPPGHRRDPPGRGGSRINNSAWGRSGKVKGSVDITGGRGSPPVHKVTPPGHRVSSQSQGGSSPGEGGRLPGRGGSPPGQGSNPPGKGRGLISSMAGAVSVRCCFNVVHR